MRVPRVHAVFEHQGGDPHGLLQRIPTRFPDRSSLFKYYYVVMDFIPGTPCLQPVWDTLSIKTKAAVERKIGEQLRLLRSVPPPEPAYYGRIHNQPWDTVNITAIRHSGPKGKQRGPYDTHKAFVSALIETLVYESVARNVDDFYEPEKLYLECFEEIMARSCGKNPVLTHMNLELHNVMVLDNVEDENDPQIFIIDWKTMGWMPAYMQTSKLMMRHNWLAVWHSEKAALHGGGDQRKEF
ncbi:hypothetical protein N0V90_012995 [Kalmusia sp. IMI 367209]|nr:hypothetical protein N0V90_012995 [Kalmusia sp. IMI 367209]